MSKECKACESPIHPDDIAHELRHDEPDYPDYLCERCYDKAIMECQSRHDAQYEYGRAKMRNY